MKKKLLIYGAGAIGRGYIPWLFSSNKYMYYYVETNKSLCADLKQKKGFTTFMTVRNGYKSLTCQVGDCFMLGEENPAEYDGIITAVGPRSVLSLKDIFTVNHCPIILFENDITLVDTLRKLTGNKRIYFGIPDVITSNTAPKQLLDKDPLSIVTEDGKCFVDSDAKELGGFVKYVDQDELIKQWMAKLYIHNTAHCVAAYLSAKCDKKYLHEGMQNNMIITVVKGVMEEMQKMLMIRYKIEQKFLQMYSEKELLRFSNVLLYDPIIRVAREPFRKLEPNNRLIGAAQLALCCGIVPENLIIGIFSAFLYDKVNDPDNNIKYLVNALSPENFLQLIIRLDPSEALYMLILERWDSIMTKLSYLPNG